MASWLGLRRRAGRGREDEPPEYIGQEQEQEMRGGDVVEPSEPARASELPEPEPTAPAAAGRGRPTRSLWRSLLRVLVLLGGTLGLLVGTLAFFAIRADLTAVRQGGQPPSWPTYRLGVRVLEALETVRDVLTPPDLRALQLSYAVFDTAIVHQLATLGALDAFPGRTDETGPASACLRSEEVALAAPTAAHAPYLYRLLRAAATRGLLEWHPERDDCFTLTALGTRFQRGSPFYALARWQDSWTTSIYFDGLAHGLRTGELPFSAVHGGESSFWAHLQQDPCRRALFDASLAQITKQIASTLAEALDEAVAAADAHLFAHQHHQHRESPQWPPQLARPGRFVCDVGGGGGGGGKGPSPLLASVLARHPGTKGLTYDLAEAAHDGDDAAADDDDALPAAGAEAAVVLTGSPPGANVGAWWWWRWWPGLVRRGTTLADARRRIKRVSGSFLDREEVVSKLGGRCDLVMLKHILHDWGDEAAVAILSHLHDAMMLFSSSASSASPHPPRLVVFEQVVGGLREDGQGGAGVCNASSSSSGHSSSSGGGSSTVMYDRLAWAMDLNMLCMTGEGRERTEAEFRALFATAGFKLVRAAPSKSPMAVMLLEPCERPR